MTVHSEWWLIVVNSGCSCRTTIVQWSRMVVDDPELMVVHDCTLTLLLNGCMTWPIMNSLTMRCPYVQHGARLSGGIVFLLLMVPLTHPEEIALVPSNIQVGSAINPWALGMGHGFVAASLNSDPPTGRGDFR